MRKGERDLPDGARPGWSLSQSLTDLAPVEEKPGTSACQDQEAHMEVQGTPRCPSCGHGNRPDRHFCTECGSRLGPTCAACGAAVEPSEKFCGSCGAALREESEVPPRAEVPRPAPDPAAGEPRQLTVLFCDLVGSTPLSQELDPEEWRDVVAEYQKAVTAAVTCFGGHVGKKMGDGLVVYFGWPARAGEDPR